MKYSVDIDEIINELFRKNIGLVPSFGNRHHYHYDILRFHPIFYRYHHLLSFDERYTSSNAECRSLINNPIWFQSPLFQLLFKSFVAAEGKFIMNYIPQNSHEERLTGHLVSELENGLFMLRNHFEETSVEIYGKKIPFDFYYRDLSSNNQEKNTGADLGLIFYVNIPDFHKHIRIAAIQAKKVDDYSARIDIHQLKTITNKYNGDAYYMFYDMTENRVSPMIERANYLKNLLDNEDTSVTFSYDRKNIVHRSIPLSVFLIFDILQCASVKNEEQFSSIWEAQAHLMKPIKGKEMHSWHNSSDNEDNRPSKILAITIGDIDGHDLGDFKDIRSMLNHEESRD